MRRCRAKGRYWPATAMSIILVGLCSAGQIEIGDSMRELVEADWINQDSRFPAPPEQALGGSFDLAHTRRVVEQGKSLAARLCRDADPKRLDPLTAELSRLESRLAKLDIGGNVPELVCKEIYLDARRLARRIAFCNPLLDFEKILFIKRHDSVGVFHMCDQYYGCNARPGGGLFVLSDPFSDDPKLSNVLENRVVERGRLKGDNLSTGVFLSPELSYDGKIVLFAYTQAEAYEKFQGREAYEWGPEISYHIFKVGADGSAKGSVVNKNVSMGADANSVFTGGGTAIGDPRPYKN